mmetsp:Transcript_12657/g.19035  ORF Transcript_12657/g.19035 Transcript_12657/m.19035 type:complete len:418 (+) Transcript_12657:60-1313(+)
MNKGSFGSARLQCKPKRFTDCQILQPDGTLLEGEDLFVCCEGKIHLSQPGDMSEGFIEMIDCEGGILSPGFIDLQLNGAYGVDFSDVASADFGSIMDVCKKLPSSGVTSFLPTLVSCDAVVYKELLPRYYQIINDETNYSYVGGAVILGLHLEGPYFAMEKRGAHNISSIRSSFTDNDFTDIYGEIIKQRPGLVRLVTLAPELPGALDVISELKDTGCIVSMGHSNATFEQGVNGIKSGATLITHLFNAMKPFHHREPGLAGLIALHNEQVQRPFVSIIVDGFHLHPTVVNLVNLTNPDRLILVTDAMSAMGLNDGQHTLGSMRVEKRDKRATIVGTETLAGSVVSMDECLRSFVEFTGVSPGEALLKCTLAPATLLGLCDTIGVIKSGADADLVLLNDQLVVRKTWVKGTEVFCAD